MSDVIRLIRELSIRRAAVRTYSDLADAHERREATLLLSGWDRAASMHEHAELLLRRAARAEIENPDPKEAA